MFSCIDHIGVAVYDVEEQLALYRDFFAIDVIHREIAGDQKVEVVLLDVGESHIELIAPLEESTPVERFLAMNGPGLHHIAYRVPDIDAVLERIKRLELPLIDEQPRIGVRGSRVAFMNPRATAGVLTEIVERP